MSVIALMSLSFLEAGGEVSPLVGDFTMLPMLIRYGLLLFIGTFPMKLLLALRLLIYSIFCCCFL